MWWWAQATVPQGHTRSRDEGTVETEGQGERVRQRTERQALGGILTTSHLSMAEKANRDDDNATGSAERGKGLAINRVCGITSLVVACTELRLSRIERTEREHILQRDWVASITPSLLLPSLLFAVPYEYVQ